MNKQIDEMEKIGKELEERLRFESLLSDFSARFVHVSSERLDGEIENALKMVLEFFQVDRCGLIRTSKDRTAWQVTHIAYADDQVPRVPVGFDFPRSGNPWTYEMLFEKRRTLAISSMDELPPEAQADRQAWIERGTRSTLLIPIYTGGPDVYSITINAMKNERVWPEEFIPRLRLLGEIFVNALERRQNRLDLEEQLRFEMVLAEISGRFVNVPAERVDSEIMDAERRICELLGLDISAIWQWSSGPPGVFVLTHYYSVQDGPQPSMQLSDTDFPWFRQLMLDGRIVPISTLEDMPAEAALDRENCRRLGVKSNLCIPLMVGGAPIGILGLNTTRAERYWPEPLIKRLQLVSQVFTNALARKRADEQLKNRLEEIEELKQRLEKENLYLREELREETGFEKIIGSSDELKYVLFRVRQAAPTDATVLILGETGTGKGMVAHAIHGLSARKDRPMVTVNCAALPANLIESELFGREKGAFTGAHARQAGRFEIADKGTIFLDEIGEMPLELQSKLLRVLQDGEFERLGSAQTVKVDVRVIAATSRDLKEEVSAGRFREDLFYRINVFPVSIPPLRKRTGDIPGLVRHFVDKYARKSGKKIETVPKDMIKTLQRYSWPGNVRELEHVIERALIITEGPVLQIFDTFQPFKTPDAIEPEPSPKDMAAMEREHILRVLRETNWIIGGPRGAASILNIHPSTLRFRIKKLGIQRP
jgi:transcriptional regulator with GAF, ATPase, and Fis domain